MLETLEIIASTLNQVPPESVEGQLTAFDAILGIPFFNLRLDGARLLQEAAARSIDPARREKLLLAARQVEAGEPCAPAPTQPLTMTLEEWQEQKAFERAPAQRTEPPPLPRFALTDLFPGLSLLIAGAVLHFKSIDKAAGTIEFDECTARLDALAQVDHLFEAVPDLGTLVSAIRAIDQQWKRVSLPRSPHLPRIESELGSCRGWIRSGQNRGDPPVCFSGPLAARVFANSGETAGLAFHIDFLFTAVLHYSATASTPAENR